MQFSLILLKLLNQTKAVCMPSGNPHLTGVSRGVLRPLVSSGVLRPCLVVLQLWRPCVTGIRWYPLCHWWYPLVSAGNSAHSLVRRPPPHTAHHSQRCTFLLDPCDCVHGGRSIWNLKLKTVCPCKLWPSFKPMRRIQ